MSGKEQLKQQLAMLTQLNNQVMSSNKNRAFDLKENVVDPAVKAVEEATLRVENNLQLQNVQGANVENLKQANTVLEADLARKEATLLKVDNYLARWTRMDLFPGITRENSYPRTAMERTQRRDFLARGTGHIYPFGHKNSHQMTGVGGISSDIIKLRRLYGRANYFSERSWTFPNGL
jgi:hypothetical protein